MQYIYEHNYKTSDSIVSKKKEYVEASNSRVGWNRAFEFNI